MSLENPVRDALHVAAVRLALGALNADEIVALAHRLMDLGIYSDHFLPILDEGLRPSLTGVGKPFQGVLAEFGISVPSWDEAVWRLVDMHTERVVGGRVEPRDGLHELLRDLPFDESSNEVEALSAAWYELDEMYLPEDIAALNDRIVDAARRWRLTNAGKYPRRGS